MELPLHFTTAEVCTCFSTFYLPAHHRSHCKHRLSSQPRNSAAEDHLMVLMAMLLAAVLIVSDNLRADTVSSSLHTVLSAAEGQVAPPQMATAVASYMAKGCSNEDKLLSALAKHVLEIGRMQSPQYQDLTRCIEAALTIMRLSCEQYFTLISVFAAYLFFRQRLPAIAREVIWVNHRVSNIFKKVLPCTDDVHGHPILTVLFCSVSLAAHLQQR